MSYSAYEQLALIYRDEVTRLRAERDNLAGNFGRLAKVALDRLARAELAEARLAAVLALCDERDASDSPLSHVIPVDHVRAAAAGDTKPC